MKKILLIPSSIVAIILLYACASLNKKVPADSNSNITSQTFNEALNFVIVSDWGWNGYNHQQEVADQMAKAADSIDAEFVVTCGDNFQVAGVASTQDPLWMSNYENIYKSNSLMVDWYPVLGNHDYKGNTQAQIDYSKISRHWRMTDRYYTFTKKVNDSISVRLIFLDTPPLIEEYHKKSEVYPDVIKQDTAKEMQWLKDVLANSKEQWILVFGHHPIYSASKKHGNTNEMIERVNPLLEKYHAQFYFCGHDHDFQHLREKEGKIEYIITGTGGKTRPCNTNDMSIFSKSEPGFSIVSLNADSVSVCFVGTQGNIIYRFARTYR